MSLNDTAGKYIVIEGHDGTGKSTQVGLLRERLKQQGIDSIEFHEPEGTPIANELRRIIKDGTLERDAITNLLLFTAARHEIWTKQALPALAAGKWVIAARNYYSTLAYQGYGEGLDLELITTITAQFTGERYMRPDVAIILLLDDDQERRRRIGERGDLTTPDTFESREEGFAQKVAQGYEHIAKGHGLQTINAARSREMISDDIWKVINDA